MDDPRVLMVLSWVLLVVGGVMLVGGLIYDLAIAGDDNLTWMYLGVIPVVFLAGYARTRADKLRS